MEKNPNSSRSKLRNITALYKAAAATTSSRPRGGILRILTKPRSRGESTVAEGLLENLLIVFGPFGMDDRAVDLKSPNK